jgi:hypothetical protein
MKPKHLIRYLILCVAVALFAATITIAYLALTARPARQLVVPAAPAPAVEGQASAEEIVRGVLAAKLAAMHAGDVGSYLVLVDERDPEYYTEQRNWFLLCQDAVTTDFSIEVVEAAFTQDGAIIARLRQHYLLGPDKEVRTVDWENRFVNTDAGWKDADLNFSIHETEHFVLKYPPEAAEKAEEVGEAAEQAFSSVTDRLGIRPRLKPTIKMYATRELLRESTDIRIAYLFNGWGEAGESIKMYAYRSGNLPNLIAHELVHKITLEVTGSQPSWFAEGLATYFGNWPFAGGNALQAGSSTVEDVTRPISWLETQDLTQITDDKTRRIFYDMAGMIVQFMVETRGVDKLHAVLNDMAQFPEFDRGYDFSMEPELQSRLYQSIETVIGLDRSAFNEAWLAWIALQ